MEAVRRAVMGTAGTSLAARSLASLSAAFLSTSTSTPDLETSPTRKPTLLTASATSPGPTSSGLYSTYSTAVAGLKEALKTPQSRAARSTAAASSGRAPGTEM
jgi:hypothetical protein